MAGAVEYLGFVIHDMKAGDVGRGLERRCGYGIADEGVRSGFGEDEEEKGLEGMCGKRPMEDVTLQC